MAASGDRKKNHLFINCASKALFCINPDKGIIKSPKNEGPRCLSGLRNHLRCKFGLRLWRGLFDSDLNWQGLLVLITNIGGFPRVLRIPPQIKKKSVMVKPRVLKVAWNITKKYQPPKKIQGYLNTWTSEEYVIKADLNRIVKFITKNETIYFFFAKHNHKNLPCWWINEKNYVSVLTKSSQRTNISKFTTNR